MGTEIRQSVALVCDGCDAPFGRESAYRTAVEVRAAAYNEGWRFPPQVTVEGKPRATASDVCSECIAAWTPQQRSKRGYGYQRNHPIDL